MFPVRFQDLPVGPYQSGRLTPGAETDLQVQQPRPSPRFVQADRTLDPSAVQACPVGLRSRRGGPP